MSIKFNPITGAFDLVSAATPAPSQKIEVFTLTAPDIANKYVTLNLAPTTPSKTRLIVDGGPEQFYGDSFIVTSDSEGRRLSWSGLFLDGILAANDKIMVIYSTMATEVVTPPVVLGDPIAYFPFNGDYNDYSGNSLVATKNEFYGSVDFVTGRLPGTQGVRIQDGHLNISSTLSQQIDGAKPRTISAWIKNYNSASGIGFGTLYGTNEQIAAHPGDAFYLNPQVNIGFSQYRYGITYAGTSTTESALNQWIHLVGTYDGTTAKLYVNGASVLEAPIVMTTVASTFYVARSVSGAGTGASAADYVVSDLRVYDYALTSQEILTLYNL